MLNVQEGQLCICVKSDRPWWTRGKEYEVVRNKYGELCFVDDDGDKWTINYLKYQGSQFKLKEPQAKALDCKYTPFEINKVILRAYQLYDNDSQRLAYIKGYFAK